MTVDKTILFVDDEMNILNSIERLLGEEDWRILRANSAGEAMELIKKEGIAVLVSDNYMPGMKGIELLSKVRNIFPDIIRILMTAQADLSVAIDAINKGEVFRFIVKPWNNDVFKKTVQEAIQRYNIIQSLKRADEPTMLSLAQTIELKDRYTRGHCDRVAKYALAIAGELNLSEETKRNIRYGSWLHDCGKIGIPETILNKKGRLTTEEFETIKNHTVWGADVAKQAQLSEVIVKIILHHHEKFDGTGYPSGISGEEIPLEARIVSIADCFDAMTSDRVYRKANSLGEGLEKISLMQNENFDPELVKLFIHSFENINYDENILELEENHHGHGNG